VLDYDRLPVDIHLRELSLGPVFQGKDFSISAFPVTHRGSGCFGFVFQEKSHWPFLTEKAEALGVPVGPERSQLVKGESITLADGTVIQPEMVLGDEVPGVKMVCIGDVGRTDNIREYVTGADVLVIEATFLEEDADAARAFGHLTAQQAATFARDAGVKTLILNHVSRRYRERDIVEEAQRVFPDTYVARDMDHFTLHRSKPIHKSRATYHNQPGESD
jgi:ribonuclease Z